MTDFEHGLLAARQAGDQALEAVLEDLVGLIHHRQHRLDDAERRFARAAEIARVVGDRLTLGRSLVDLANIAWDRGRMGPDHPAIVEGLALLRQTGDLSSLAGALNMLCVAYLGTGDGVRALESAEQALTAAREASDKSKEATSLSYLGHVNSYLGLYDRARQHTEASMALAREIQHHRPGHRVGCIDRRDCGRGVGRIRAGGRRSAAGGGAPAHASQPARGTWRVYHRAPAEYRKAELRHLRRPPPPSRG